ncbi:hypothetical protein MMC13_005906 [Lambiella insularis]|nr:hypothetical protein [Lambiella insularis]
MTAIAMCNVMLVELLENRFHKFSEKDFPLHETELKSIKRCTELVKEEGKKIIRNVPKRRAHIILKDLWTHIPEAFILCALVVTPSQLGTLKSTDYMESIFTWWHSVVVPRGLAKTLDSHSDILPKVLRDSRELQVPISLDELLEFVRQNFQGGQLQMCLPYSGSPLPFVRIKREAKLELSWQFANAFIQQRQKRAGIDYPGA